MKLHSLSTSLLIALLAIGLLTAIAVAGEPAAVVDPEWAPVAPSDPACCSPTTPAVFRVVSSR